MLHNTILHKLTYQQKSLTESTTSAALVGNTRDKEVYMDYSAVNTTHFQRIMKLAKSEDPGYADQGGFPESL